jgi:toxin HigB-1
MINSFGDELTENIFNGIENRKVHRFPSEIRKIAKRKLDMIEFAASLQDLKIPPANRLEKLKGDLQHFYSIRINDQWRIIFSWELDGAYNVQIIDYH